MVGNVVNEDGTHEGESFSPNRSCSLPIAFRPRDVPLLVVGTMRRGRRSSSSWCLTLFMPKYRDYQGTHYTPIRQKLFFLKSRANPLEQSVRLCAWIAALCS
jgi:hypothetical protein